MHGAAQSWGTTAAAAEAQHSVMRALRAVTVHHDVPQGVPALLQAGELRREEGNGFSGDCCYFGVGLQWFPAW